MPRSLTRTATALIRTPHGPVSAPRPAAVLKPPPSLSSLERRYFVMAVEGMPVGFYSMAHQQQLVAYARHAALSEALADALHTTPAGSAEWSRISAAQVLHSKAALAHARSLRLTPQSQADRDGAAGAARQAARAPAGLEELRLRYAEDAAHHGDPI